MRMVYASEAFDVAVVGDFTDSPDGQSPRSSHYSYTVKALYGGRGIERLCLGGKRSPKFDEEVPAVALLAILIDHLYREHLDNQPREIALALTHLEQALLWYQESTNKKSPRFSS